MSASRNYPDERLEQPWKQFDEDDDPLATPDPANDHTIETVIVRVDGSYHPDENLSVAGFILETNTGRVLKEEWVETPRASTSMETEAAAMLQAIKQAKTYSPSFVAVYSDCMPLVRRVENHYSPRHELKPVYQDIHFELDNVDITNVMYVPREQNKRADELAHRGARIIKDRRETVLAD